MISDSYLSLEGVSYAVDLLLLARNCVTQIQKMIWRSFEIYCVAAWSRLCGAAVCFRQTSCFPRNPAGALTAKCMQTPSDIRSAEMWLLWHICTAASHRLSHRYLLMSQHWVNRMLFHKELDGLWKSGSVSSSRCKNDSFLHVEVEPLDLEEQPPVNQCHSLNTMTAAQSWLYNVWVWDSQQLCLLHSAVWGKEEEEERGGRLQNGWQLREKSIDVCDRDHECEGLRSATSSSALQ